MQARTRALRSRARPPRPPASNDHHRDQNVGKQRAEAAAEQIGGYTLLPRFDATDRGTDWNDYARTNGADATRTTLLTGVKTIQIQARAAEMRRDAEAKEELAHARTEARQQAEHAHVPREVLEVEREREELDLEREMER